MQSVFHGFGLLPSDHQCNTKMKKHGNDHRLHQIRSADIDATMDVGSISTLTFEIDMTV